MNSWSVEDMQCPITNQILLNPVITKLGHSWEESILNQWMKTSNTCPLTKTSLTGLLINSKLISTIIQQTLNINPELISDQYCEPFDSKKLLALFKTHSIIHNPLYSFDLNFQWVYSTRVCDRILEISNSELSNILINCPSIIQLLIISDIKINSDDFINWICTYGTSSIIEQIDLNELFANELFTTDKLFAICKRNFSSDVIKLIVGHIFAQPKLHGYLNKTCMSGYKLIHTIVQYQKSPSLIMWICEQWINYNLDIEYILPSGHKLIHIILQYHTDFNLIKWICEQWIKNNFDLDHALSTGHKPIHMICQYYSNPALIEIVLEQWITHGLDLSSTLATGFNPIHIICSNVKQSRLIKWICNQMITGRLNSNVATISGWKPIHLLCRFQTDPSLIKWICAQWIYNKLNLDSTLISGHKPIHLLCKYQKDSDLIKWICKEWYYNNFDLEHALPSGHKPIHLLCACQKDSDLVKWIWRHWIYIGLDLNNALSSGHEPIHLLYEFGTDNQLLKWIISYWFLLLDGVKWVKKTGCIPSHLFGSTDELLLRWTPDQWLKLDNNLPYMIIPQTTNLVRFWKKIDFIKWFINILCWQAINKNFELEQYATKIMIRLCEYQTDSQIILWSLKKLIKWIDINSNVNHSLEQSIKQYHPQLIPAINFLKSNILNKSLIIKLFNVYSWFKF
jgi:hypothetical protein